MKVLLSTKGMATVFLLWYAWLWNTSSASPSVWSFAEKDWRDKQKSMDNLRDTVDRQKRDLDSAQKEIVEKEMLCSALRVSCPSFNLIFYTLMHICTFFVMGSIFYVTSHRNRWHIWRFSTMKLRLPRRRPGDFGPNWKPLKGICIHTSTVIFTTK